MVASKAVIASSMTKAVAQDRIDRFIDGLLLKRNAHIPGNTLQRAVARIVPANSRVKVRIAATDLLAPRERLKAQRIVRRASGSINLHLGSGELPRHGWINIDLFGVPVDLKWNMNRPLPFPNASVDAIFHEHLLEHLTMDRALELVKECYRVTKPGGVLRIAVPDARRHIGWYASGEIPVQRAGHATHLMSVLQEFYGHGHRAMYDFETLALLCHAAGFHTVERRSFGDSRLSPCPDHEWREWDSLYVEMVR